MMLKRKTRTGLGSIRLFVLVCLTLGGCAGVNRPPEYESPAVKAVCNTKDGESVEVSFKGQTRRVIVDFVPTWDELYTICGDTGGACVNLHNNVIHMVDDRRCIRYASHELGHVFGVPGLDIPKRRRRF